MIGATGFARRRTIPEGIVAAPNAQLTAIMARDENRLREYSRECGGIFYTTRLQELLARGDVDAVYIATPMAEHAPQIIAVSISRTACQA